MINDKEEHKTEILIIRRHGGDDHAGHKGGAWKIAYADFVTAMMAFFLVMWLINSANEATRARVASYFNPIKMTDAAPAGKGLKDSTNVKKTENKTKTDSVGDKPGQATDDKNAGTEDSPNSSASQATDETLRNPYKLIEQISQEGQAHPSGKTVDVVSQKTGDPFDPKAWEALREGKQNTDVPSGVTTLGADAGDLNLPSDKPVDAQGANVAANQSNSQVLIKPTIEADQPADQTNPAIDIGKPVVAKTANPAVGDVVTRAENEIKAAIADAGAEKDLQASVKKTSEGLLIVLSDVSSNPMFAIGSAKPTPALIEVIDAVGKILETQDGQVVVRGHTDARRYKSLNFDNWQLSTARAHMASYILMHGGLDEKKILKIEGYGSSEPLDAADPMADANRRVEFLLRK